MHHLADISLLPFSVKLVVWKIRSASNDANSGASSSGRALIYPTRSNFCFGSAAFFDGVDFFFFAGVFPFGFDFFFEGFALPLPCVAARPAETPAPPLLQHRL